jgi:TPR repeat protein
MTSRPGFHGLLYLLCTFAAPAVALPLLSQSQPQGQSGTQQDSPVFKSKKSPILQPLVRPADPVYETLQTFLLARRAAAGDTPAQHELGIRYLLGVGVEADTALAAHWIGKAAEGNVVPARFNYAILQYNGWGTPWDPFGAFKSLSWCAARDMMEADFFLGLFYIEGYVVPIDLERAHQLIERAANRNFKPAVETLPRLKEYIGQVAAATNPDSAAAAAASSGAAGPTSALSPVFLEFDQDSTSSPGLGALLQSAMEGESPSLPKALGLSRQTGNPQDSSAQVRAAADAGSPEALTFLGRAAELGRGMDRDRIRAASFYLRATRMESPRAARHLIALLETPDFVAALKDRAQANDPEALFVFGASSSLGFDGYLAMAGAPITPVQAKSFLAAAAKAGHPPAMIELGLVELSGKWGPSRPAEASSLWERAAVAGNMEATIRLAILDVRGTDSTLYPGAVSVLRQGIDRGSVLAELGMGYCHETGRGAHRSAAEAARFYRDAARRGSSDAGRALRRLHDEIRPEDPAFVISD